MGSIGCIQRGPYMFVATDYDIRVCKNDHW